MKLSRKQTAELALYLKSAGIDVMTTNNPANRTVGFVTFFLTENKPLKFTSPDRDEMPGEIGMIIEYDALPEEMNWQNNIIFTIQSAPEPIDYDALKATVDQLED